MATVVPKNVPPSAGWISYDGWDYNGTKEHLERFMSIIRLCVRVAVVGPVHVKDDAPEKVC
jgi:hypothetical protein